jgi:hypothetical protein
MIVFWSPAPATIEYTPAAPPWALQNRMSPQPTSQNRITGAAVCRSSLPDGGDGALVRGVPDPELPVSRAGGEKTETEHQRATQARSKGFVISAVVGGHRGVQCFGAVPGEEERQSGMEAGVADGGAVAPEHRNGVRRRAVARLLRVGHVLRRER